MNLTIKNPRPTISVASSANNQQQNPAQQAVITPTKFLENVQKLNQKSNLPPAAKKDQDKGKKTATQEPIKFDDINNIEVLKDVLNQGNNGIEKVLIENENASLQMISQASFKITVVSKEKNIIGQNKTVTFYAGGLSSEEVKDLIVTAKRSKVTAQIITPGSDAPQRLLMNIGIVAGGFIMYKLYNTGVKRLTVANFRKRLNESIIKRPQDIIIELDSLKNIDWTNLQTVKKTLKDNLILDDTLESIINSTIKATDELISLKGKENTPEFKNKFNQLIGYISGAPGCGKSTIINALTKGVLHKLQENNIPVAVINLESIGLELAAEGKTFDMIPSFIVNLLPGLTKTEKSALIAEAIHKHGGGNGILFGHDIGQQDGKGVQASVGISNIAKALVDGRSTKLKEQGLWGQITAGIPSDLESCRLALAVASNYDPDQSLASIISPEQKVQIEAIKDRFTFVQIGLPNRDLIGEWVDKKYPNVNNRYDLVDEAFYRGLSFRKLDTISANSLDNSDFLNRIRQVNTARFTKTGSGSSNNSSGGGVDGMVRSGVKAFVEEIKSSLPGAANFSNNTDPNSIESKLKAILDAALARLQSPNSNEQN